MLFPEEHQCGLSFLALNREHSDSMNGGGGGGQEDNSYQYLSQSKWGLSRFPPPV